MGGMAPRKAIRGEDIYIKLNVRLNEKKAVPSYRDPADDVNPEVCWVGMLHRQL